jgi:hypothetical protein
MDSKWPYFLILLGLSAALPACRLAEREMQDRTPQGCANCHTNIAQQWERSAHAAAWTDPEFIRQTRERSINSCLPCHASLPLLEQRPGESPRLRDDDRPFGVECRTCHQLGEAYAGPYESRLGPHPTEQDTARLPCSMFCGICHELEEEEHTRLYLAAAGSAGKTCVQCHMPTSRERLTQGHVLSYIHPKRIVHDHAFPSWSPSITAGAVEIGQPTAARTPGEVIEVSLTLRNRGAGHRIPSGKFGYREMQVAIDLLDADGRSIGTAKRAVHPGQALSLAPGVATEFVFEVVATGHDLPQRVRVLVQRLNKDRSFQYTLAEGEWPILQPAGR